MNKSPSWLGFEVLPGGFVTEIPLAGGELLDWEIEAFRAGGVESRRELNQFYLSERGRQILLENLKRGSYRLSA